MSFLHRILPVLALPAFLAVPACVVVAPPEDFPVLPLPEAAQVVPVAATRVQGGFLLSEEEYGKALRNVQNLRAEIEALRRVIGEYNRWAESRRNR